jgi:hypothetical protein
MPASAGGKASRDVGACRQSRKEEREASGKKGSSIEGNETLGDKLGLARLHKYLRELLQEVNQLNEYYNWQM